jgi:precorrin-3B synthase
VPYLAAIVRRVRAANPIDVPPDVRGECPSVHQPFHEVDGSLIRVRVPGGILSGRQVGQVASVAQKGATVEITSRANLQIRGTAKDDEGDLTRLLVAAGVTHPDALGDSRRNVLASPTSGHDPEEIVDCRLLIADIEGRLIAAHSSSLSPKFGVLIDGGGAVHVRGQVHDICLGATRSGDGPPRMEVSLGRALPTGDRDGPAWLLEPADVGVFVSASVEELGVRQETNGRMSGLVAALGHSGAMMSIARRAHINVEIVDPGSVEPCRGPSVRPIGVLADHRLGMQMVGAMPILGRLSAETLDAIARLAVAFGDGEVRLTPWRSLLLTGVAHGDVDSVREELRALDLVVDPADPALNVVACAGNTGCPSGLTDAQADGRQLIEMLRTAGDAGGASVHVSGCSKGCAGGDRAFAVTLQGGPTHGIYTMIGDDGPLPDPRRPADALRSAVSLIT